MELIRISTAGSVDDGKSTIIGQLLVGTNSVSKDKLQAIAEASIKKGCSEPDLSLLTDGLMAEREQGITIDVAHIFFSTPKRKYIIADSPGHLEYTRNMVTGASTAEIFVILIDVQKGISDQTYRHAYIANMLQIPNVLVCVNKMDRIDFDQKKFEDLRSEFIDYLKKLNFLPKLYFIPTSALLGDNVIQSSKKTPWYKGLSLLETIESCKVQEENLPFRFKTQNIIHFNSKQFIAGKVISGSVKVNDKITVLPSGAKSSVSSIHRGKEVLEKAKSSESITIELDKEIEIKRGDILAKQGEELALQNEVLAEICWLDEEPGKNAGEYLLQHGTKLLRAKLLLPFGPKNIKSLQFEKGEGKINLNEISDVNIKLESGIPIEAFSTNRYNGDFILIDLLSNKTIAVGFVK